MARAEAPARWRLAPAEAPVAPSPYPPAPDPLPLGRVGQISFWEPSRGLLITGGTEAEHGAVSEGLYAYDGVSWHQLSIVCGGEDGRIAWAGPDEFWTIAAQRAGQITSRSESTEELESLSLCHFVGDRVVASYAMPLGEASSYRKMDAAACLSPDDCWFAGEDGEAPNAGSFHLHWNGSELNVVYDMADHAVTGLVAFAGKFYEGLAIGPEDTYLPEEYLPAELESGAPPAHAPEHPPVIRTIAPFDQAQPCDGVTEVFCDKTLFSGQPLPIYAPKSKPYAVGGFELATDGSRLGVGATQLWAAADPLARAPAESGLGKVTILHGTAGGIWTQVLPSSDSASPIEGGTLQGSEADPVTSQETLVGGAIAPVPGTETAWLSLSGSGLARVQLLEANGHASKAVQLPEEGEDVGYRGESGPIACPAQNDCWMATTEGWLFHLSNGSAPAPNTDPLFDGEDPLITYRPIDASVEAVYPDGFAEEDALKNQQPAAEAPKAPETTPSTQVAQKKKAKPLVKNVKSKFLHGRTLVITFTLTARAHVQLIARKHKQVVAKTRNESLRPGSHKLSLTLNPARWPTKLSFQAKPIGSSGSSESSGSAGSEEGDTVTT